MGRILDLIISLALTVLEGGPLINLINTPTNEETRLLTFTFHKVSFSNTFFCVHIDRPMPCLRTTIE